MMMASGSQTTVAVVGLFNCFRSPEELQKARKGHDRSVMDALSLPAHIWPRCLYYWKFRDHREVAVPLTSGLSTEVRSGEI